jgi:required for meiotic nuclear division protein 1
MLARLRPLINNQRRFSLQQVLNVGPSLTLTVTRLRYAPYSDQQTVKLPKAQRRSIKPKLRKALKNDQDPIDKQQRRDEDVPREVLPCTTVSTCEEYDLGSVIDQFYSKGLRGANILLPEEIAHVKFPFSAGKAADVLVLSNGSIVAWGMTEVEVMEMLVPMLRNCEIRSYKEIETEDMDYIEEEDIAIESGTGSSSMIGDVIHIKGESAQTRLLDKAAFSSGLARNTKLACLEISLEKYIGSIKEITDRLATGKKLGLGGSDVLKITGRLLQIRGNLNLYSELIETPDLYWSEPELEALYKLISSRLDVVPRIAILNKKLDYAAELVEILQTHTSEQHSTRLEWMIIALITIEVCFEIFHFVERKLEVKEIEGVIEETAGLRH